MMINNYPFCRLQLVVETNGNSTKLSKQSKFNKISQVNKKENIIIKLLGLVPNAK